MLLRPALVGIFGSKRNIYADVIIYGATPGGITAAIAISRMSNLSVAIVGGWRENRLGGMMVGGLGATDTKNMAAVTGIPLEIFNRIAAANSLSPFYVSLTFQPSTAVGVFASYQSECGFKTFWDLGGIDGCNKNGARITGFHTQSGYTVNGKVFIDATYEGDLIAFAGVSYTTGRESSAQYGESQAGINFATTPYFTGLDIDPYMTPGVPSSGLLPRVMASIPAAGSASPLIMAASHRPVMTSTAANLRPWQPSAPRNYNALNYEITARVLASKTSLGQNPGYAAIMQNVPVQGNIIGPKQTYNCNNAWGTDLDNGGVQNYVDAGFNYANNRKINYGLREQIIQNHINYEMGFYWWLQYSGDSRIPAPVLAHTALWWLCLDETPMPWGTDPAGFPAQFYIRECRRMQSDYFLTQADMTLPDTTPPAYTDVVAATSYNGDSHTCTNFIGSDGFVANEGNLYYPCGGAMATALLPYSAMRPRQSECDNLLSTWTVSASHVANCCIRLEPGSMALGQAAGAAAALALANPTQVPVQQIPITTLQSAIRAFGSPLTLPTQYIPGTG